MALKIQEIAPIPEQTKLIAKAAFPKGNLYINMRDTFGTFYKDELFADLFSKEGATAQAPWQLALICVMQFVEGLSDRQAAEAVRSRIDWKYALSLELTDAGFDFSVLSQFRERLVDKDACLRLLETMLNQFVERGLLKSGGRQRTDSTHVLAAVRVLNRLELVGETLRHALETLATIVPDWLQQQVPVEWYERYGSRMENYRFPKGDKARTELAASIGTDGLLLLSKVDQVTQMPWLRELEAIVILRQVWTDQFTGGNAGSLRFKEGKERTPSSESISSPYDTDARYSTKRDESWIGYKVHLTETCNRNLPNLITDVQTCVATAPDESQLPVIQAALKTRDLLPKEQLVDAGYANAATLASSQTDYGITVTAPVGSNQSWQAEAKQGFDKSKFVVNWQSQVVTCPAGKTSLSFLPCTPTESKERGFSYHIRFAKQDCANCGNRAECTRSKSVGRELMLHTQEQHEALQAARHRQTTPEFKEAYNARAGIESTHAQGIRRCGLREARYLGIAKTSLQHVLTAAALNLVRVGEWLFGSPRAKTRISRFAQLAPA